MRKLCFILFFLAAGQSVKAQEIEGTELGFDAIFHASNFGGTFGVGTKYGMKFGEYLIAGPSFRYQRAWNNNFDGNAQTGFNVWGGGVWAHARFFNALFVGAEFEYLKSPYNSFGFLTTQGTWSPTLFVGGGASLEINEKLRLNAGIFYDVIDNPNSPLRTQYFMRNEQEVLLPIIYRIAIFIPLS